MPGPAVFGPWRPGDSRERGRWAESRPRRTFWGDGGARQSRSHTRTEPQTLTLPGGGVRSRPAPCLTICQARDGKGRLTTAGQVPPGTQDTPILASSLLGSVTRGPHEPLAPPAPHACTSPHSGDLPRAACYCPPSRAVHCWGGVRHCPPGWAGDATGWERSPHFPPVTERRAEPGWLPGLVAGSDSWGGEALSLPCSDGGAAGPELRAGDHCRLWPGG